MLEAGTAGATPLAAAWAPLGSEAAGQLWELALTQLHKPSPTGEVFLHLRREPVRVSQKAVME